MRSMRLRPVLVTAVTGVIGAAGVTAGTIVPPLLPAATATAAVSDEDEDEDDYGNTDADADAGDGAGPGADRQPSCGRASDPDFPIDTRIHGGPDEYLPGGPPQTWSIDLTNSTAEACHNIHPVIVLSDRHRSLTAAQVRLQLTDDKGRWRTMSLEKSDEDETIAVLEGGFPGFAVPGRQTVTVRARLAFTAAAVSNSVVANAATVQRRGGDGDWVGESNDYRFSVRGTGPRQDHRTDPGTDSGSDPGTSTSTGDPSAGPRHEGGKEPGTGEPSGTTAPAPNSEGRKDSSLPLGIGALADTGSGSLAGPAIAAVVFVVAGAALIVGLRRPRKRR
ncbi:hypothetical protein OIE71_11510 [Streptomyces sp. NBC_01725]|uniref:hypothetical protein n=1 Tax=Streptomyces sp. NBC_01725 TaxID=2975923 RepID=UPI002E2D6C99|nr:hypothetical protein [Streptomyces sp. NBC_01725]